MVVPKVPLKLNHWKRFIKLVQMTLPLLAFPPPPLQINFPVSGLFQSEGKMNKTMNQKI